MVRNSGEERPNNRALLSSCNELAGRAESRSLIQNSRDRLQPGRGSRRFYGEGTGAAEGKMSQSRLPVMIAHHIARSRGLIEGRIIEAPLESQSKQDIDTAHHGTPRVIGRSGVHC